MKALIVVDMLKDFLEEDGKLYVGPGGRAIMGFVAGKISEFRRRENKVIYICDSHEVDDMEFENFPPHCVKGSSGAEIVEALSPSEGDKVVEKRRYSGFFGTDLDLYLRERKIEEIELVGVCTNICVLYTAADARNHGYKVRIYKEGVASFDSKAHEFALSEAEKTLGCEIV